MAKFRYRNDHDTERFVSDLAGQTNPDGTVRSAVVKAGEEFDSDVELHNPLLTPLKPSGLAFSQRSFRWVSKKEAEAEEKAAGAAVEAEAIPAESEQA